jgi:UDP-N-acetylmuramoyl-L-alanyl-D-glutamate--2,6-diaminopimelate ligase
LHPSSLAQTGPAFAGITADSRAVRPGWLFAALPGVRVDGASFIPQALAAGATHILAAPGTQLPAGSGATLIVDSEPRRRLAQLAAAFYHRQPETVVAVTGTQGKSSTVHFVREIWAAAGLSAATLGTMGIVTPARALVGALTTPDPVELHRLLAEIADEGVTHLALEASSHGLDQYRLDGVRLAAGAFLNLARDHLDYHPDMQAYFTAKAGLFERLLPSGAPVVINADDPWGARMAALAAERGLAVWLYGSNGADLRLLSSAPTPGGQVLSLSVLGQAVAVTLPLVGPFQASNALAALGLALATGVSVDQGVAALAGLRGVRGRMELVAHHPNGAPIYVDYAHKPGALESVLAALRVGCAGRLHVVFGCGGDRDAGKRPQMGAIAARLADRIIVTDDNPRTETASLVRAQILAACPGADEIADRADAITTAVAALAADDVLVIAGKGHEDYQIIGTTKVHFDDAEQARAAVGALAGGAA